MITLQEAMLHLRVDDDTPEGVAIQSMIDASVAAAEDYLGGPLGDPMPAPVRAAILLQVGDLYENRERQGAEAFYQNRTYERLLNPYRLMAI